MPLRNDQVISKEERHILKIKKNILRVFEGHSYSLTIKEIHRLINGRRFYPYTKYSDLETALVLLIKEKKLRQEGIYYMKPYRR